MERLTASQMHRAMQIFVSMAYSNGNVPENRRHFARIDPKQPLDSYWKMTGVERLPEKPGTESGYAFRIGNTFYPHMKLTVQPYEGPVGYVFGVDTHDQFKLAPASPELAAMKELQGKNQELARSILESWENEHLPTQSSLLRDYIERARLANLDEGHHV